MDLSFRAVSLPSAHESQSPQKKKDGLRDGLLKGVLIGAGTGLGFSAIVYAKGDGEWGSYRAFAAGSVLWVAGIGALIGVVFDAVHRASSAPSLKPIIPTGHDYCAAGRLR